MHVDGKILIDIVKNISTIIGLITGCAGLAALFSKNFRSWFRKQVLRETTDLAAQNSEQDKKLNDLLEYIKKVDEKVDSLNSTVTSMGNNLSHQREFATLECRIQLERIYNEGMAAGRLSFFKRQAADNIYKYYTEVLNENSWGKLLYDQLIMLPVDKYEGTNPNS